MKAGKTNIDVGTKIEMLKDRSLKGATGKITHAFGCYGSYDHGAIAGVWIDNYREYNLSQAEVNLFKGDFKVSTI